MRKPLAIDLYCGLGGWTEGLLAEGYDVIGFDVERHIYDEHRYPAQLVLQDVRTLHGSQLREATLIVASPPCQKYSYMAMPWSRAKQIEREYLEGKRDRAKLTELFDACFRIQREAIEAAGHHIPLVVENVRGAQKWVGRSRWNFGSYHLWGDVPALMPITMAMSVDQTGNKSTGMNWSDRTKHGQHFTRVAGLQAGIKCGDRNLARASGGHQCSHHWTNPNENGMKQRGDWFNSDQPSISRRRGSKSSARKAASAMIARIPLPLAQHIARYWYPR